MNKEFIPYNLALDLKELGFDEPCLAFEDFDHSLEIGDVTKNSSWSSEIISVPLYQQAFRWLRETYNIDVDIIRDSEVHYQDETKWIVKVSNWNDIRVKEFSIAHLKFPDTSHHIDLKSYDEALKIGLEEALKFIKK